mmetsp:Transcript_23214/g.39879  ORF Transcript_23214/g.39879 Transcript_23214/m.39879 type:complete len:236 (-) Transcript_23214:611-1318(-)
MAKKKAEPLNAALDAMIIMIGIACLIVVMIGTVRTTGTVFFIVHPLCMGLGVLVFMTSGVTVYRAHYGDWMDERSTKRKAHRTLQLIGGLFVVLGLTAIIVDKMYIEDSRVVPSTLHGWLAVLVIAVILMQVTIGLQKYSVLAVSGVRKYKWHGRTGSFIHVVTLVILGLGAALVYDGQLLYATYILLVCLGLGCVLRLYLVPKLVNKVPKTPTAGSEVLMESSVKESVAYTPMP